MSNYNINDFYPRTGQEVKDDGTVINEANGINPDGSKNVQITGNNVDVTTGRVKTTIRNSSGVEPDIASLNLDGINPGRNGITILGHNLAFNETNFDRVRNNTQISLLPSAARTATISTADQTNYNAKGIRVYLDVTNAGTGSITLEIDEKDPASGKYIPILTGAAVTTVSTTVYKIYPGLTAVVNSVADDVLPRTYRVTVTHNNANSITYSVGQVLIL